MTTTATRKPAEITSATIARCTCRATGEVFYLVASDSHPGEYHTVHFDESRASWVCDCPSYRPCRHERAVNEVLLAKRELEQVARTVLGETFAQDLDQHIEDSIRSGEFADSTSCYSCGALCKGGVCMDCLSIAA